MLLIEFKDLSSIIDDQFEFLLSDLIDCVLENRSNNIFVVNYISQLLTLLIGHQFVTSIID